MITEHHDGHGLNESIEIRAVDDIGSGGAHHRYEFWIETTLDWKEKVGALQFQKGPRNEPGSTPGVTEAAVIASIIDRLVAFQAGPFPSPHNDVVIFHLREALFATRARADERA